MVQSGDLNKMMKLGVNIDHVATLRQVRGTSYPSVVQAALRAEEAGADSITLHLREDRRHIQDADLHILRGLLQTHMNLECSINKEMLAIASEVHPQDICLVPERREERTTEGGLDVQNNLGILKNAIANLQATGIRVSLFINPDSSSVLAAHKLGASVVELHTGRFADAQNESTRQIELLRIRETVTQARDLGLTVNAGHGLNYFNVHAIASIAGINELNIGHAIVAHALFVGWDNAVREMKELIRVAQS